MRVKSEFAELRSPVQVTGKLTEIHAFIGKDGKRSLTVNGETVTSTGPPLVPQPKMGLSVGEDQSHNVGNYSEEKFKGIIQQLTLEVD